MWTWTTGDADAIQIQLSTTTGSFSYTGTFARPAILTMMGGKFIRMPIPGATRWPRASNAIAPGASPGLHAIPHSFCLLMRPKAGPVLRPPEERRR